MYHQFNFYKYTFAIFKKVNEPTGFVKPHYISKHGSWYFFTKLGVYRYSNHWGRVGNCRWRLEGIDFKQQTKYWGYCDWTDFFENNEGEKIYYIEKIADNSFTYNHKKNSNTDDVILRSAADTAKVLKKINEILQSNQWAKHLNYTNFKALQDYFIHNLITTNKSLIKIKQEYLENDLTL